MTTGAPERERVRGFLLSQGEKYTIVELRPRLTRARLDLIGALDGLSEAQAAFTPAAEEWCINDIAAHLLESSASVRRAVEKLAAGQSGDGKGAEPGMVKEKRSLEQVRGELLADSLAWASVTERLPAQPSFEALAPHPFFGRLHARAWYLFQRVHDVDHFNQIEAVKKAPGYPEA